MIRTGPWAIVCTRRNDGRGLMPLLLEANLALRWRRPTGPFEPTDVRAAA